MRVVHHLLLLVRSNAKRPLLHSIVQHLHRKSKVTAEKPTLERRLQMRYISALHLLHATNRASLWPRDTKAQKGNSSQREANFPNWKKRASIRVYRPRGGRFSKAYLTSMPSDNSLFSLARVKRTYEKPVLFGVYVFLAVVNGYRES